MRLPAILKRATARLSGQQKKQKKVDFQALPNLLTIEQVSELFGVHPNTLRNWDRTGKLRAVRIGPRRDRRYERDTIQKLYKKKFADLMDTRQKEPEKKSKEPEINSEENKYVIEPGFFFKKLKLYAISRRFSIFIYSVSLVAFTFLVLQVGFFAYIYFVQAGEKQPIIVRIEPLYATGWEGSKNATKIDALSNSPLGVINDDNSALFRNMPVSGTGTIEESEPAAPVPEPKKEPIPVIEEETAPEVVNTNTAVEEITEESDIPVDEETPVVPEEDPEPEPPLDETVNTNLNVNASESVNTNTTDTIPVNSNANTNTDVNVEAVGVVLGEEIDITEPEALSDVDPILSVTSFEKPESIPPETEVIEAKLFISAAADSYTGNEDVLVFSYTLDGSTWNVLEALSLAGSFSNATNEGYWEFILNDILTINDIQEMEVRIAYNAVPGKQGSDAYIDGIELELSLQEPDKVTKEIRESVTPGDNDLEIDEDIELIIEIEEDSPLSFLGASPKRRNVQTFEVIDPDGEKIDAVYAVKEKKEGKVKKATYTVDTADFSKPGKYIVTMTIEQDGRVEDIRQDFIWGVLAINPDQSIYKLSEESLFSIGILDDAGDIVCDADVTLLITDPSGQQTTRATSDGSIIISEDCRHKGEFLGPDYSATYLPPEAGVYTLDLSVTHKNGTRTLNDSFIVQESPRFTIKRTGPTRIFPYIFQPMTMEVTAYEDYVGGIREMIPGNFEVSDFGDGKEGQHDTGSEIMKTILWDVALTVGESVTLSYTFKTPEESPALYFTGPATIGDWDEGRQWQMAIDVVYMYLLATSASAATGWTDDTATFDNDFVRGAPTYSATGDGNADHTHSISSESPSTPGQVDGGCESRCVDSANVSHTHAVSGSAVGNANNEPANHTFYIWKNDTGVPSEIPQNTFGFFDSNPGGVWTQFSAADDRLVKIDNSHTTAGSDTHTHALTWGSLSASSGSELAPAGFASAAALNEHTHTAPSGTTSDPYTSVPANVTTLIYQQPNASAQSIPSNMIALFDGHPGAGGTVISDGGGEDYYQRFIQ